MAVSAGACAGQRTWRSSGRDLSGPQIPLRHSVLHPPTDIPYVPGRRGPHSQDHHSLGGETDNAIGREAEGRMGVHASGARERARLHQSCGGLRAPTSQVEKRGSSEGLALYAHSSPTEGGSRDCHPHSPAPYPMRHHLGTALGSGLAFCNSVLDSPWDCGPESNQG